MCEKFEYMRVKPGRIFGQAWHLVRYLVYRSGEYEIRKPGNMRMDNRRSKGKRPSQKVEYKRKENTTSNISPTERVLPQQIRFLTAD